MAELTRLGRYRLVRVLGRGAMGVVYEGLDPALNRRVAVKTILRNAAIDDETAQAYSAQFAREAQAAGRLNHPHIVQVHDFSEEGDVAYLVMEFIQGRELRSFFEAKERFDPAEAVRVMGELLDALHFAHEAGVIHRDVKPANVMLDAQRRVKLADFGVARIQDSERSAAGTMVGTPAFMSPEQIQGGKIDRRTDIFSAGVVLYQLLTGEQPFTGAGAWTVAKKIMQDDPPRPSAVVQSVSPAFDEVVHKALAKTPAQRYASARAFADALRAAATSPGPVTAAAKPAPRASEAEVEFWRAIQNSNDPAEFEFYLEQFPDGTYAQLARHKVAKLKEPVEAARKEAEEKARQAAQAEAQARARAEAQARAKAEAEERARQEAEALARREAAERARCETEEQARRLAAEKARREAEEKEKREAEEKAKRVAEEKAKREAEARARQAAAPVAAQKKSFAMPALIGAAVLVIGAAAAYVALKRAPAPATVAEAPAPAPAPAKPAAPAVDEAKIRREVEDRMRREFAEKAAAEKLAAAKTSAEKEAAERAAQKATAERIAAEKAAADKAAAARAAADKAAAEKQAAERAAAERLAAEKAAAEKAAAEKAASDRLAAEKAAAERAAADKAAADKAAADKAAAARAAARPGVPAAGDRWVYEAREVNRPERRFQIPVEVTSVNGTTVTESIQRPNGETVELTHRPVPFLANPAPGIVSFSPYLRAFQDLREGTRWGDIDFRRLFRCTEAQFMCSASGRVAGRERVTVKAGTYDAVKVVVEVLGRAGGPTTTIELRYWYAESVNRFVKYELRTSAANFSQPQMDMELLSYTPGRR